MRVSWMIAIIVLSMMGCTSDPAWYRQSGTTPVPLSAVRDREAELSQLRTETATARVTAAKKEAEVLELRGTVTSLRRDTTELHQTVGDLRRAQQASVAELAALRKEREQLLHTKNEEQWKSLQEALATLTKDLEQVKQGLAAGTMHEVAPGNQSSPAVPLQQGLLDVPLDRFPATLAMVNPSLSMRKAGVGSQLRVINALAELTPLSHRIVQSGDTLLGIAKEAGVSVERLRRANHLQTDRLTVGQWLSVPAPMPPVQ